MAKKAGLTGGSIGVNTTKYDVVFESIDDLQQRVEQNTNQYRALFGKVNGHNTYFKNQIKQITEKDADLRSLLRAKHFKIEQAIGINHFEANKRINATQFFISLVLAAQAIAIVVLFIKVYGV
ncbi:MAG: hypothetical protein EBR82_10160 [Caulobacteraceae bacterium]|nr:hypothetical protein [Caulobacteraceae bacterium]